MFIACTNLWLRDRLLAVGYQPPSRMIEMFLFDGFNLIKIIIINNSEISVCKCSSTSPINKFAVAMGINH